MTKEEYIDLYEALSYGHDVELCIEKKDYFCEWCGTAIDVFLMEGEKGSKVLHLEGNTRNETIQRVFAASINGKSLDHDYCDIQIIDIE